MLTLLTVVHADAEPGCLSAGQRASKWMEAATRAHAILTQSLPDEVLDELSANGGAHHTAFRLPPFLFG